MDELSRKYVAHPWARTHYDQIARREKTLVCVYDFLTTLPALPNQLLRIYYYYKKIAFEVNPLLSDTHKLW